MSEDEFGCGCCAGNTTETPALVRNAPGLPAIAYRVGTHATFKSSLLARLSSTDFPALVPRNVLPDGTVTHGLGTRRDDDWTIGLCDAFAAMGDVLTFYQERIANESYLRTAVERRSVLELARLVGYQLAPGVAASTALAFALEVPLAPPIPAALAGVDTGPPLPTPQPVTIPVGTRVQSVPGPDELAQTFETVGAIVARPGWNSLGVQLTVHERPYSGQTVAWLAGNALNLAAGDTIAFIGAARENNDASALWEVRTLTRVGTDPARGLTRVEWVTPLGQFAAQGAPPGDGARVYAFRQNTGLWGSNAIDPTMIDWADHANAAALVEQYDSDEDGTIEPDDKYRWLNFAIEQTLRRVDLDAVYPRIARNSWLALSGGTDAALHDGAWLYRIDSARAVSLAKFGLAGKATRLIVTDDDHLDDFALETATAHAQSEELTLAERPLSYPLFGDALVLRTREPELANKQMLAVQGKRQRLLAPADPTGIVFPDDAARIALPFESFIVLAPPVEVSGGPAVALTPEELDEAAALAGTLRWTLADREGTTVTVEADVGIMRFAPALDTDATVDEIVTIGSTADALVHDPDRTTVKLVAALTNCYDRSTVRINANVAPATHGESVGEIAGSGSAALANQRFALRQSPLTYVSANNPKGREATLTVRVNDVAWNEVASLFEQPPTAHVYALRQQDDGTTIVQFGDGIEGARLPTGSENLRMAYRKGLGLAGNVRARTLTSLLSRPVGVKSAVNPLPAAGGEDPEKLADARGNAPNTVLTLDRAVSVLDYGDFARAFAGIGKAVAAWIPFGRARGMHITIAGAGGTAITADTMTYGSLLDALRDYGDALLPLTLQSYVPATVVIGAKVAVKPGFEADQVLAAADAAIRHDFAFDAREFGMPVTLDGVLASAHRVEGVLAVDVDALHRSDTAPGAQPEARIFPSPGTVEPDGTVTPAELLTLDPAGLTLEVMT